MAQVITLACGHPWEVPAGSGPVPPLADISCPLCHTGGPTPPPPRPRPQAVEALGALLAPGTGLPAVPGYEVLGELGRGGMGVVYLARQVGLNRRVALKMIAPGLPARQRELERFRSEAESVARLQHPNIVQIFEVGEWQGAGGGPPVPYFALEFVDGGSLDRKLNGNPLPGREAAQLVETLARAMQVAHERGLVHRDLKPANVLLQTTDNTDSTDTIQQGRPSLSVSSVLSVVGFVPKITDFGIAKRLDQDSGQTRTGDILGTPSYMAPEQARGSLKEIGPRTDVYALGALLYECLTGRPPFRAATGLETLEQVRGREPVPPRQLQPKCPRDLETICLKCLRKQPEKRYASALELGEDLRRFLDGRPIRARPVGWPERLARWGLRHPAVAVLAALVVVVLLGGFAGVSWKWHEAEQQRRRAEEAEVREKARADAEADARARAEQAQQATARALKYVAASSIAATLGDPAGGPSLLGRVGKRPEVIRSLEQACAVGEQLLDDNPPVPLLRSLGERYAELGVFQAAAGRRAEAVRSCRRGLDIMRRLAGPPDGLGDRKEPAVTCFVLGAVLMILNQHEEAIPAFEQAIAHQRAVLDESPKDGKVRKALSSFCYHLAHVQLEAGHRADSAATALERQKLWPDNADEVYDVASELARCAARVGRGKTEQELTPQERQERGRYADQAVGVLRQAAALGLKDAAAVKRDPDLKPLQARDDFRQLVEELAARERRQR
jgi:serine/threonine protein kinase